jgi:hypothetical protein
MPVISFSTMKEKILSGEKKQTIRPKRSDHWLRFKKGDRLVGYWKLRSKREREKLFDSVLSENPFIVKMRDFLSNESLLVKDGFKNFDEAYKWFLPRYGWMPDMEFIVIRWV